MNWKFTEKDARSLITLVLVSLLFTMPIIISNVYYRDDLDRVITGYYGWSFAARPLADLLMMLLTGSGLKLVDYAPFSTILSSTLIGFAAFIIKKMLDDNNLRYATFISALFIINPLFLQNLLYRYDSLPMSLAMTFAVASYAVRLRNIYLSHALRAALAIASLSLYQPCFNVFIALLAVELMASVSKKITVKESIIITIKRGGEYICYYAMYFFTVGIFYAANNSRAKFISFNESGLTEILSTKTRLVNMIASLCSGPNYKYIALGVVVAAIACIYLLVSRKVSFTALAVSLLISIVAFVASFLGPTYLLMSAPVLPRAVVTISVALVVLGILIASADRRFIMVAAIPAIPFVAFSAQVSNAISDQRHYEDNIFNMVSYDILNKAGDYNMIKIVGTPAFSKRSQNIIAEHPSVKYMISAAGGFQASFILESKGLPKVQPSYGKEEENAILLNALKEEPSKIISDTKLYSIYKSDDIILVDIGK